MANEGKNEGGAADKGGESTTNPVYHNTGHRPPLKRVYLYRILNHDDMLVYETDRPQPVRYEDMPTEIGKILREIAGGLKPIGTGHDRINWRKRNYFVIVYEDPNDSLDRGNAITFRADDGGGNHTFHDGKDIPDQGEVRRFFCINQMQKKGGGDLGSGHEEGFELTVNHLHRNSAAFKARPEKDEQETTLEHNATGTNTGPPE